MNTPETDLGFPTKGTLKRVPFPNLLRDIAGARITGSLYLMSGETKKVVFFVDGRPTVVRSNLATEFLGQVLTDQGLITQEQCDNTLEAIRRTGKKQGELLVEMGILSENNLRYCLEEQLRRKLFEIFAWDDGRFQFKPGAEPGISGAPPAGTTEALILAAVQERFSDERAREALRAWADRYPVLNSKWGGDPNTLDLLPEELYFLRCLDGSRTTDEVLSRRPDLEVPQVSTLVLGLISAGVVEPGDTKLARRLAPLRPNLAPPSIPDEQLAPNFEVASTIGEYEDTPLPSRLPTDLGASSTKNPRVPILPTEDEEMFRGLHVDESVVSDPRTLRAHPVPQPERPVARSGPAPAAAPASEVAASFDAETDFSDLHAVPTPETPAPAPATEAPRADSGKHKLGPPPGLATLLRKDGPPEPEPVSAPPTAAPVDEAAMSHTSAALALLDDNELPDDLPDDFPDSDELLAGDEAFDEIEELEEIDDDIIEDEDEGEDDDEGAAVAADPGADEGDDDDLPSLSGLDLEAPLSAAPITLDPAPADDLPEEPGDLGDLAGLAGLAGLDDLGADDDAALAGPDALADDSLAGVADDLLAGVDDDLLLADGDDALPDLGDLDDLDLGDLAGDLDLPDAADLAGDLDLPGAADLATGDLAGDLDLPGAADLAAADLGEDDGLGGVDLPALDGEDLDADDLPDLEAEFGDDLEEDGEPELAEFGDDAGYADEPLLGSTDSTYVGPSDDAVAADAGAETYAAMRYSEAEAAMQEGDYDTAVALFEDAYSTGLDSPYLHGHLAFARYRASGGDPEVAQSSLELLDYAEQMAPGLALLHAYRGAILVGLGDTEAARECFDRALYLDPYCELALEYRDAE